MSGLDQSPQEQSELHTGERLDFEGRVDALEVTAATNRLQVRYLTAELEDGHDKFKYITEMLQKHEVAIELLKQMKEDIKEIKACVKDLKDSELQNKGAWKVVIAVSAIVGMIVQGVLSYFFGKS